MTRRVFFSFEYEHDVSRALVVSNSWGIQGIEAAGREGSGPVETLN